MQRRDLWRDRRFDDAEIDSGALQSRGGWRTPAGRGDRRLRASAEDGRAVSEGTGGIDQEIFAATGARRDLGRIREGTLLSPERIPRCERLQDAGGTTGEDRQGARDRRESAFLSRGRAGPVRADPEESQGGGSDRVARGRMGARDRGETVRD